MTAWPSVTRYSVSLSDIVSFDVVQLNVDEMPEELNSGFCQLADDKIGLIIHPFA